MAAICARKRSYPGFYGGRFYFFDPTEAGLKWYSRNRPPDAIFHLVPDFGKKPELKECPKIDMARCLLFQSLNIAETPGPAKTSGTRPARTADGAVHQGRSIPI